VLAVAASALHAQPPKPSEYQVKAAYLYNFGKFVRWPGTSLDQFSICILGHDPFGPALDAAIGGVTIDGQRAIARRLGSPRDALSCRVVFISTSEDVQLGQILEALNKAPVLTVSDIPQFTSRGGMIQFIADANRVRFEVNLTTAETAGLMLSSELLKVAVAVRRIPRSGA
jgi:hypothetical protein